MNSNQGPQTKPSLEAGNIEEDYYAIIGGIDRHTSQTKINQHVISYLVNNLPIDTLPIAARVLMYEDSRAAYDAARYGHSTSHVQHDMDGSQATAVTLLFQSAQPCLIHFTQPWLRRVLCHHSNSA